VQSWEELTGFDSVFAWKASKFITHWKRLSANCVNSLELLEDRLSLLGDKAGRSRPVPASAKLPGRRGAVGFLPQTALAQKALQFRISPSELVLETNHAPVVGGQHLALHFRPS
jgi:hypothetical protein